MEIPYEALFLIICALITAVYIIRPNYTATNKETAVVPFKEKGKVIIYTSTPYFGSKIEDSWTLKKCKNYMSWCHFTDDPVYHSTADAVLFHANNFKLDPKPRFPEQIYVWFTQESSVHEVIDIPPDYINWTMTYRNDSDVWYPYNQIEYVGGGLYPDLDKIWDFKKKDAVWVASNCLTDNRRSEMIHFLGKKGLQVNIFGDCGTPLPNCGRFDKNSGDCLVQAVRPYKFYMALENSNCMDYVTEKFWDSLYYYEAIPIVIKREYYQNYGIPDSAYIAIEDFKNDTQLIVRLNEISRNKTAYLEYHQWRKTHRIGSMNINTGYCGLCQRLRDNKGPSKSYKDLAQWFSPETQCEQRLLDKYLGRTATGHILCNFYSIIYSQFHWDCA